MGNQQSKTVGVKPAGEGIEVRFMYRGVQMRPRLRLPATKANLLHAGRLRAQIVREIATGTFILLEHFPDYKFAEKARVGPREQERTLAEWFAVWAQLAERELEHSSLAVYKRHMRAYWLPAFGHLTPGAIRHEALLSHLSKLAAETVDPSTGVVTPGLGRKTQNNILIPLRRVFALISRAPGAAPDPTAGIQNLKVQTGNPDPFSLEEVEIALADTRQHYGSARADFLEFAAFAGMRVSEQIALQWSAIDLRTGVAIVRAARVLSKDKARTKTSRERAVELNDRALGVIQRQRARTQAVGKHVFVSDTTGRPWNDEQRITKDWALTLRRCGIRHRPPKELRDSSVTFSLMAGADPYYVAQQHGHSLTTMLKDYAKWIPNADRGRNRAAINQSLGGAIADRVGIKEKAN